ncbi:MAG: hypothetical protein AABW81_04250 [Nanoarchaeota archaeon]
MRNINKIKDDEFSLTGVYLEEISEVNRPQLQEDLYAGVLWEDVLSDYEHNLDFQLYK